MSLTRRLQLTLNSLTT